MDARTDRRGVPPKYSAQNGFVRVRGAREHNLKDVSLDIPRIALIIQRRPPHPGDKMRRAS
jgi:excinuclease ABC subunit A